MRAVSFSDIHGHFSIFKKSEKLLNSSDIVILCGDITDFGDERDLKKGVTELRKYFNGDILGVTGNCDYPSVDTALENEKINLHARVIKKYDLMFAGLGGSLITPFSTPNEYSETDYRFFLDQMEKDLDNDLPIVLVAHQPPKDCGCDRISTGESVGSIEIRAFIERNRPVVCFSGHIHEAVGKSQINDTIIVNSGLAKKGFAGILDYNSGRVDVDLLSVNKFMGRK